MELSENEINDYITSAVIKTLKILKETLDEGDDLNTIDYDYIIDCRMRDLNNPQFLESINSNNDNLEEFK